MKQERRLWTREELILAINLYCKLPFGRLHSRNPEVIQLAENLGRTPGSVALKLVNFASLDPSLQARGIKGASNTGTLDKEIWAEFYQNWDELPFQSEELLAKKLHKSIEELNNLSEADLPRKGEDRERMVKQRVNQHFFRRMVLSSYNNQCCITGIAEPSLLVASHIRRWADDAENRMNPSNGLCLNALHDRSFETGLIGITPNFQVKLSSKILKSKDEGIRTHFWPYEGMEIKMPKRFLPSSEFLAEHFERRFLG